jgi:hypothetical protein
MPAEVADKMTQARIARAEKLKQETEALRAGGDAVNAVEGAPASPPADGKSGY